MVKKLENELGASLDIEEEEFKSEEAVSLFTSVLQQKELPKLNIFLFHQSQPTVSEPTKKEPEEAAYSSEEENISYKAAEKNTSVDEDSGGGTSSYTPYNRTFLLFVDSSLIVNLRFVLENCFFIASWRLLRLKIISLLLFSSIIVSRSEDVFKQLEASWDTSDHGAANVTETATATIYKPDETLQDTSYEEFDTPFRCTVLYNYTVKRIEYCSFDSKKICNLFNTVETCRASKR